MPRRKPNPGTVSMKTHPELFLHDAAYDYIKNNAYYRGSSVRPVDVIDNRQHGINKDLLMRQRIFSTANEYKTQLRLKNVGWTSTFLDKTRSRALTSFGALHDIPPDDPAHPSWRDALKNENASSWIADRTSKRHEFTTTYFEGFPPRPMIEFVIDDWITADKDVSRKNFKPLLWGSNELERTGERYEQLHLLACKIKPENHVIIAARFPTHPLTYSPNVVMETIKYLVDEERTGVSSPMELEEIINTFSHEFRSFDAETGRSVNKPVWSLDDAMAATRIIVDGGSSLAETALTALSKRERM